MTIPQILTFVGWPLFAFGVAFMIIHSLNIAIPDIDFIVSTGHMPLLGYLIAAPATILGLLIGLAGFFGEQIHEYLIEKNNRSY